MWMLDLEGIRSGVIKVLKVNMNLREDESVLLLSDVPQPGDWNLSYPRVSNFVRRSLMVRKMYDICREEFKGNRVDYLVYPSVGQHGSEPPAEVAERLLDYDVVLAIPTYSISHTRARQEATKKGARLASMPGLEYDMLLDDGPMAADYRAISEETERLAERLTEARVARVTTEYGTDITFSLEERAGGADTGIMADKGQWGNLPGGEAYIAPVEGTARGRLVLPAGWYFELDENTEFEFADGYVISVKGGGKVGEGFRRLLSLEDDKLKPRRNCAELGIGTNPKAKKPDNVLEAEKIRGTVHIAIGDSSHLGGVTESDLHEDFVLPEPTLYLDGKVIIEKGKAVL